MTLRASSTDWPCAGALMRATPTSATAAATPTLRAMLKSVLMAALPTAMAETARFATDYSGDAAPVKRLGHISCRFWRSLDREAVRPSTRSLHSRLRMKGMGDGGKKNLHTEPARSAESKDAPP